MQNEADLEYKWILVFEQRRHSRCEVLLGNVTITLPLLGYNIRIHADMYIYHVRTWAAH